MIMTLVMLIFDKITDNKVKQARDDYNVYQINSAIDN